MKMELTIRRNNGKVEKLDITNKIAYMTQKLFDKIKTDTKNAGRGDVLQASFEKNKNNLQDLIADYNRFNNEGGEGYIPPANFFIKSSDFEEWTETIIIK